MQYKYIPQGVCSMEMIFDIENNIIKSLEIVGGCPGNTVGVARLVAGKSVDEVIDTTTGYTVHPAFTAKRYTMR